MLAQRTDRAALHYIPIDRIDGNVAYCYPNGSSIIVDSFRWSNGIFSAYIHLIPDYQLQPRERGIDSAIVGGITDGWFHRRRFQDGPAGSGHHARRIHCCRYGLRKPGLEHGFARNVGAHLANFPWWTADIRAAKWETQRGKRQSGDSSRRCWPGCTSCGRPVRFRSFASRFICFWSTETGSSTTR